MTDPLALIDGFMKGFNARDEAQVLAVTHPEIVLQPLRWVPRQEYRGHDGVREWLAAIVASGNTATATVGRVRRLSREQIVVEGTLDDGESEFVGLYEIRDERISAIRAYFTDGELIERLGLLGTEAPHESDARR